MKDILLPIALVVTLSLPAAAAITVPGADGSDNVLNITDNTEIDLSQAVTGTWNQNNSANAGKGVYDPAKWAIVFKYSSVTVAAGKTLTFKNHPSRAPVVWLVSGNVTIDGTVSLDGKNNSTNLLPLDLAEPGPGGFRGGAGSASPAPFGGAGFGPGGGLMSGGFGGAGAYGVAISNHTYGGTPYGNPSLIPLIGGSGGAGDQRTTNRFGGGGGGGAILIAATGTVMIGGELRANGGTVTASSDGGGGSGGGIRVVCDLLTGSGKILTLGGDGAYQLDGSSGRVRLERVTNSGSLAITPDPSIVPLASGASALLWPPAEAPEVKVVSIGGTAAPADPRASFGSAGADVALAQAATTQVVVETRNVEQASQVQVRLTKRSTQAGDSDVARIVDATVSEQISANPLVLRWTATVPVTVGYSAVQVKVVRP